MGWSDVRRRKVVRGSGITLLSLAVLPWLLVVTTQGAEAAPPGGPVIPAPYNSAINQGNVPTTAKGYTNHKCDEFAGKSATDDGWLFVGSPSDFTAIQAQFTQDTVTYDRITPANNDIPAGVTVYYSKNYDHLAITTPGGWTLNQAFATLDPQRDFFTLSHTCAATSDGTPTPTPSTTPSETPSPTPSATPSETPSATPSATPSETPSETPSATPSATPSQTPSIVPSETPSVLPTETESPSPSPTESTEVLPTKIVKSPEETSSPTPSETSEVLGEKQELPMTGFPIGSALALSIALLALGALMVLLPGQLIAALGLDYNRRH